MPRNVLITLVLGFLGLVEAQTLMQIYLGQDCSQVNQSGPETYLIYENPEKDGDVCITFGAPGYPQNPVNGGVACRYFTNGGSNFGACNHYPVNSAAFASGGVAMTCALYSTDNCRGNGNGEGLLYTYNTKGGNSACIDVPPHLPLSDKQSISSMHCTPNCKSDHRHNFAITSVLI